MQESTGVYKGIRFSVVSRDVKEGVTYVTVRLDTGQVRTLKEAEIDYDEETPLTEFLQRI